MTTEYRRMALAGPESGRWVDVDPETADRLLKAPYGVGALGDQRADVGQIWESRRDGGRWLTFSYWSGALDFWTRARMLQLERLRGDEASLRRKAQALRDGAGATIEGLRNQIAAAEEALKLAQEAEKRDKAEAREVDKQADTVKALTEPVQRELDRGVPEPVTA